MWDLYQRSKTLGGRPSQHLAVPPLCNDWAAYQFDNAVLYCGTVVENALQEQTKIELGKHVEYRQKYTLAQLLDPDFRLPRPLPSKPRNTFAEFAQQLMAYAGKPGSKNRVWTYVGPEPEQAA